MSSQVVPWPSNELNASSSSSSPGILSNKHVHNNSGSEHDNDNDSDNGARVTANSNKSFRSRASSQADLAVDTDNLYTAIQNLVKKMDAHKTIGSFGSISLIVNNCTGGAMVLFPGVFQQNGWLPVSLVMFLIVLLVYICGLLMIEAQAMIPGNGRFQKRAEFTTVMRYFMPPKMYIFWQAVLQFSLFFSNVAMIIQSVQVSDTIIQAIAGFSCAVPQMAPSFSFNCPTPVSDGVPFPDGSDGRPEYTYMITLGWWLTAMILIPCSTADLEENVVVQDGAFICTLLILVAWISMMSANGLTPAYLPAIGPLPSAQMLGVILFNFGVTYSLPSWANEKKDSVNITRTFAHGCLLTVFMYLVLGMFGAMAFQPFWKTNETMLSLMYTNIGTRLAKITYFMFPAIVNLSTVMLNAVYMRYNLLDMKLVSRRVANLFCAFLPWVVAIPLYVGNGFQLVVTWTGIFLNMPLNFIVPVIVYIVAVRMHDRQRTHGTPLPPFVKEDPAVEAKQAVTDAAKRIGVDLDKLLNASEEAEGGEEEEELLMMIMQNQRMSQVGAGLGLDVASTRGEDAKLSASFNRTKSQRLMTAKARKPPKPVPPPPNPFSMYRDLDWFNFFFWLFTLPARVIFHYTIPHGNHPLVRLLPSRAWIFVSFFLSTAYICVLSYIVVWMSTVVADHFNISHFLTGATIVAASAVAPSLPLSTHQLQSKRAAKLQVSLSQDVSSTLLALGLPLFLFTVCVYTGSEVKIRYGAIELVFLLKFLLVSLTIIFVQSEQWVLTPNVVPVCALMLTIYYVTLFLVEWTPLSNLFASDDEC